MCVAFTHKWLYVTCHKLSLCIVMCADDVDILSIAQYVLGLCCGCGAVTATQSQRVSVCVKTWNRDTLTVT